MDYRNRQSQLIKMLVEERLDAVLITHLPNIRYLCGFTGSAGALALSHENGKRIKAIFFTDGRYTQQAKDEVNGARVQIRQSNALVTAGEWLQTRHKGV